MHDREPGTGRHYIKRLLTVELYEPGSYNLTFIRAHSRTIPEFAKIGNIQQSFSMESGVIDDRYVLPVTIASLEGKLSRE